MDATATQVHDAEPADSVRLEPCPVPSIDDGGPLCRACGWPIDEHDVDRPAISARAA